MANPNDEIRDRILRHLYEVHQLARGPKGVAIGIRDLHHAMKAHGIKQADVNSNLDYLIQKGWIREVIEQRTFRTPRGTTQQAPRVTYKISDIGIDKLEAASAYRRPDAYTGINVTNIRGVTVIGPGNIVNVQLTDLANALTQVEQAVLASRSLSEEEKLNTVADIETIHSQLSKPQPNYDLIRTIWGAVEKVVTGAGLVEAGVKVAELIKHLR